MKLLDPVVLDPVGPSRLSSARAETVCGGTEEDLAEAEGGGEAFLSGVPELDPSCSPPSLPVRDCFSLVTRRLSMMLLRRESFPPGFFSTLATGTSGGTAGMLLTWETSSEPLPVAPGAASYPAAAANATTEGVTTVGKVLPGADGLGSDRSIAA